MEENNKTTKKLEEKLDSLFSSQSYPDFDSSAIIEKTLAKIHSERRRRHVQMWWLSSLSLAASVLIGVVIYYFVNATDKIGNMDFYQIAENVSSAIYESNEVVLITSEDELQFPNKSFIQYNGKGEITVNGNVIETGKTNGRNSLTQIIVPVGKKADLQLSDGTRLMLNSRSRVIFPQSFDGKERKIFAEGEVYMEVSHDKSHPFVVESSDFNLRVLGTKFNISTYKELGKTEIVLLEGAVEVADINNEQKALLAPDELLNVKDGHIAGRCHVDAEDYISWTKGLLNLKGMSLSELMNRLGILYGVDITCNESVASKRIYGKLELKDNLNDILYNIQQIIPVQINTSEQGIELIK